MSGEIDTFLRILLQSGGETTNMSPLCERLTSDIAGQMAFGQPLNTQTDEAALIFPRAMMSINALISLFSKYLHSRTTA